MGRRDWGERWGGEREGERWGGEKERGERGGSKRCARDSEGVCVYVEGVNRRESHTF